MQVHLLQRKRNDMRIYVALFITSACALIASGCAAVPETTFLVRIENISGNTDVPTPFAPGIFAVHNQNFGLFVAGEEDGGYGLEALAEDGNPRQLAEYIKTAGEVFASGVFSSPKQDGNISPLFPGEGAYEFSFTANTDAQYLSFATMFVQSNDLFFAPRDAGIKLFRFGAPISGDITRRVLLWDALTEINEEPGEGVYQAPRQTEFDSGSSETGPIAEVNDRFEYPRVTDLIRVTITPQ